PRCPVEGGGDYQVLVGEGDHVRGRPVLAEVRVLVGAGGGGWAAGRGGVVVFLGGGRPGVGGGVRHRGSLGGGSRRGGLLAEHGGVQQLPVVGEADGLAGGQGVVHRGADDHRADTVAVAGLAPERVVARAAEDVVEQH